jgi:transitional endoplasmic reticulum ATPase
VTPCDNFCQHPGVVYAKMNTTREVDMSRWRDNRSFSRKIKKNKLADDPYIKRFNIKLALRLLKLLDGDFNEECLSFILSHIPYTEKVELCKNTTEAFKNADDSAIKDYGLESKYDKKELYSCDPRSLLKRSRLSRSYRQILDKEVKAILRNQLKSIKGAKKSDYKKRLNSFGYVLGLDKDEQKILFFYFLIGVIRKNETLFEDEWESEGTNNKHNILAEVINVPYKKVVRTLGVDGLFFSLGLVVKGYRFLKVTQKMNEFFLAGDPEKLFDMFFEKVDLSQVFDHDEKMIKKDEHQILTDMFKKNNSVKALLAGSPGCGKTSYAATLAKETGKELYMIKVEDQKGNDSLGNRRLAMAAAEKIFNPEKQIILVDEADKILNQGSLGGLFSFLSLGNDSNEKAWVNDFLTKSKNQYIYITNRVSGIDESTKRRFNYTLMFPDFSDTQRTKAWQTLLTDYKVDWIKENDIEDLSRTYEINPGSIDIALKTVTQMGSLPKGEKRKRLEKILENQLEFVKGKKPNVSHSVNYTLDGVNSDISLEGVIENVKRFYEYTESTPKGELILKNYNICLAGAPGLGKTAFAHHLAQATNRKLIVKRASDLKNMYVGETEKLISAAFKEAQESNSILLIDEIDSMLGSREGANASWEVSQVNQLLCEMEQFSGCFIASTNYLESIDEAALRRFTDKVSFDFLKPLGKLSFYERYLKGMSKGKFTKELKKELQEIPNLSIGDFKVVRDKNFFRKGIEHKDLIAQLKNEVSYKKDNRTRVGL